MRRCSGSWRKRRKPDNGTGYLRRCFVISGYFRKFPLISLVISPPGVIGLHYTKETGKSLPMRAAGIFTYTEVRMNTRAAAGQISMFPMPAGGNRKKRTEAEEQAIAMMKEATPEMVELILEIARNEEASVYTRLQAAELILNRSMGRPETYLKVEAAEESVEEAAAGLMNLFREIGEEEKRKMPPLLALAEGAGDPDGG